MTENHTPIDFDLLNRRIQAVVKDMALLEGASTYDPSEDPLTEALAKSEALGELAHTMTRVATMESIENMLRVQADASLDLGELGHRILYLTSLTSLTVGFEIAHELHRRGLHP